MACDWPGNVRQLQNVLERAAVLTDSQEIRRSTCWRCSSRKAGRSVRGQIGELGGSASLSHFCGECGAAEPACCTSRSESWPTLAECESRLIRETLEHTFYNQSAAARLLGIDWRLFARKMHKYGISVPRYPPAARERRVQDSIAARTQVLIASMFFIASSRL